jgi:hypothetical protein
MKEEYDFSKMRRRPVVVRDLPPPEEWDHHIRIRIGLTIDKDVLDWCKTQARANGETVSKFVTRLLRELKEDQRVRSQAATPA